MASLANGTAEVRCDVPLEIERHSRSYMEILIDLANVFKLPISEELWSHINYVALYIVLWITNCKLRSL